MIETREVFFILSSHNTESTCETHMENVYCTRYTMLIFHWINRGKVGRGAFGQVQLVHLCLPVNSNNFKIRDDNGTPIDQTVDYSQL